MRALGIQDADAEAVLGWYARIVAAVTDITAGRPLGTDGPAAYAALSDAIGPALDHEPGASLLAAAAAEAGGLERERVISNAAVLLFGGIETTEGMIANAVWHLLSHPDELARVRTSPELLANAIEESLRLEPAAAIVDRYATADVEIAGAAIARGELVRVSIAAANRDPAVFAGPRSLRRPARQRGPAPRLRARPACLHRDAPRPPGGARPPSSSSWAACPSCASTRTGRPRRAGSCFASRPSCTSSGPRRHRRKRRTPGGAARQRRRGGAGRRSAAAQRRQTTLSGRASKRAPLDRRAAGVAHPVRGLVELGQRPLGAGQRALQRAADADLRQPAHGLGRAVADALAEALRGAALGSLREAGDAIAGEPAMVLEGEADRGEIEVGSGAGMTRRVLPAGGRVQMRDHPPCGRAPGAAECGSAALNHLRRSPR